MIFQPQKFKFDLASFPFVVIAVVGFYQLIPQLIQDFSWKPLSVLMVCFFLVLLWMKKCSRYRKFPNIEFQKNRITVGDNAFEWTTIESIKFVTKTIDPYIILNIKEKQESEDGKDDVIKYEYKIYLTTYKNKYSLLRKLAKEYESTHKNARLEIPTSNLAITGSWLFALLGSSLLILFLFALIFSLVYYVYQ
jgi:hypothetical protein